MFMYVLGEELKKWKVNRVVCISIGFLIRDVLLMYDIILYMFDIFIIDGMFELMCSMLREEERIWVNYLIDIVVCGY